jgi:hypothetical protein
MKKYDLVQKYEKINEGRHISLGTKLLPAINKIDRKNSY